jgi:hypothetical protein
MNHSGKAYRTYSPSRSPTTSSHVHSRRSPHTRDCNGGCTMHRFFRKRLVVVLLARLYN